LQSSSGRPATRANSPVPSHRCGPAAPNGYAVDRATVRQSKTGRPVRFELIDVTRHSLDDYLRAAGPANACSPAGAARTRI